MNVARRLAAMLLWTALTVACGTAPAGCASSPSEGYAPVGLFPEDVSTVAIPIFVNESLVRDVEFELTDAVVKEMERRTPYKVTAEARADSILLGRIRSIELDQLSKSRVTALSEEVILSVTIDFEWKDLRTGAMLVERKSFSGQGLFVPSRPTGEPIAIGEYAAVQLLARDVVDELRSNW